MGNFVKNGRDRYVRQAKFCKFMANAKRIEIIDILKDGEKCVEDIAEKMNINIPNVSQHLAVMKKMKIVEARREGVKMFYKITSHKIFQACLLMEELMYDRLNIMTLKDGFE